MHVCARTVHCVCRLASETVEVDADLLRRHITLVGGSYTGIFVDDIGKANDPCTSLTVGDQILKVGSDGVMQYIFS